MRYSRPLLQVIQCPSVDGYSDATSKAYIPRQSEHTAPATVGVFNKWGGNCGDNFPAFDLGVGCVGMPPVTSHYSDHTNMGKVHWGTYPHN